MRVLAISSPYASHFMPIVPLMWALRAAGHDVMLIGQPDVTGMGRSAGLPTVTIGELFDVNESFRGLPPDVRPFELGAGQEPAGGWESYEAKWMFTTWVYHSKYMLEPYLGFARDWRPDLILTDSLEFSGLIIGGVLGVPTVQHRWGSEAMTPSVLNMAKMLLHGRSGRYGLECVPHPAMTIAPSPPSLVVPEAADDQLIRPVPYNGGGAMPSWIRDAPAARRICVSFGLQTLDLGGLPIVRNIAAAVDGIDGVEAVVTLSREQRERLGPMPDSVRLVDPVPINLLTDVCDLVCHHGGGGTTFTAIAAGLPHLLLPQIMDQRVRCELIEKTGAGIALTDVEGQNDPAVLRQAIVRLLEDDRHRNAAIALQEEAEALPSPAEIATKLEELA